MMTVIVILALFQIRISPACVAIKYPEENFAEVIGTTRITATPATAAPTTISITRTKARGTNIPFNHLHQIEEHHETVHVLHDD
nr:unnamed protein product [Haemonchus contortus]